MPHIGAKEKSELEKLKKVVPPAQSTMGDLNNPLRMAEIVCDGLVVDSKVDDKDATSLQMLINDLLLCKEISPEDKPKIWSMMTKDMKLDMISKSMQQGFNERAELLQLAKAR